jgi:hypothetical protein
VQNLGKTGGCTATQHIAVPPAAGVGLPSLLQATSTVEAAHAESQLTDTSIEELSSSFAQLAGPENAALLRRLLHDIQQRQQQLQAAAAATATDAAADELQLEVDLLPVGSKEERKVSSHFTLMPSAISDAGTLSSHTSQLVDHPTVVLLLCLLSPAGFELKCSISMVLMWCRSSTTS